MRVKERLYYFAGIALYIVLSLRPKTGIETHYSYIDVIDIIFPIGSVIYSVYIAHLDGNDADAKLDKGKSIEDHFIG